MLIFLADKHPYDLQALYAALQGPGREVVILEDGPEIVHEAHERQPDVVVVSQSLGRMGGLATSRELKVLADIGTIREPKVLVLLDRQADAWVAGWSRCDRYMLKPVDPAAVDHAVEEMAGQPAAQT